MTSTTSKRHRANFVPSPNFQVFYKLFSERKLGIISTCIILTANYFQLNIFLFQSFQSLQSTQGDLIKIIDTVTSYFYTINIIPSYPSVYTALRIVLFVISIGYLLLFLLMRWAIARSRQIKGLEKIFAFLNTYYTAVFLLPSSEMACREIFCDEKALVPLKEQCAEGSQIALLVFAAIAFSATIIMTILTGFYSLNGIYDKKNYLSGENRLYEGLVSFIKISVAIIMANSTPSRAFLIAYLAAHLILSLVLIIYYIFNYPYNKLFIEYFVLMWISIYFVQALALMAYVLIDEETVLADYLWLILLVTAIPAIFSAYRALKLRIINKERTSSTKEFILKIQHTLQLKQNEKLNTFEEIQLRGILALHIDNCKKVKCFCKETEKLYDPKKRREYKAEEHDSFRKMRLKYHLRSLFEDSVKTNSLDPSLLISYAEFLFEKFRNTHLALFQITKIAQSNRFLHPYNLFKILKLKNKISDYINTRNLEALEKKLEIEYVIFLEEQLDKVIQGMREIIGNSINFWNYLTNRSQDLNKLGDLVDKMHASVDNTEKLWAPLKSYLYKQKKMTYFYNFFLKDFLHKKIQLNEEQLDELFDSESLSTYSNGFLNLIKDDNVIFKENSVVIHMSGDVHELGKIIKTNRTATRIFKYSKDELEKSNINILMPKLIGDRHNSYLDSHIQTGNSNLLYNQKMSFAKDRDGFIIPIWMVVKQLDNPEGHVQYAGLLRPLLQSKEKQSYYILMNDFGEISGVSKNLSERLKIPGDVFHKKTVNMVLLAPLIIKKLYFAKLLEEEKEKKVVEESEDFGFSSHTDEPESFVQANNSTKQLHRGRTSPFMQSPYKVSKLNDFIELDKIRSDGAATIKDVEHDQDYFDNEDDNKDDVSNEKMVPIEFTLRLPQKLDTYLKQFQSLKTKKHDLLNNQQLLINAVENKGVLKSMLKNAETNSTAQKPASFAKAANLLSGKRKGAFHLTSYKHSIDSYIEALKTVSNRIAKNGDNNVYTMTGWMVTDEYGPDKDIIKYLKITHIKPRVEKFSNIQIFDSDRTLITAPNGSKTKGTSNSLLNSQSERGTPSKSKFSQTPAKPLKSSAFKSYRDPLVANDDEEKSFDLYDGDIPKESNLRNVLIPANDQNEGNIAVSGQSYLEESQASDGSSKKDVEEEGPPKEDEAKTALDVLKDNLLAPFQSIYQKEENSMIDSSFRSLNRVKWFIRLLFSIIIPLNIALFFAGANSSFNTLDQAVNDVYLNEKLKKDFLRAYDTIVTVLLNNAGMFASLTIADSTMVDNLVIDEMATLQSSYKDILSGNDKNEWTNVLYKYLPTVQDTTSMNYKGVFQGLTIDSENSIQKLINSLSEIILYDYAGYVTTDLEIQSYRSNSFEKFNIFLSDVTSRIFTTLDENFARTERLSTYVVVAEGVIFFISFCVVFRLIIVVIRSLKEILLTFTAIDNKYLSTTQQYYHNLRSNLESSVDQYINDGISRIPLQKSARDNLNKSIKQSDMKPQKMFRSIDGGNFMKSYCYTILFYYFFSIMLSCGLTVVFHVETQVSLQNLNTTLTDGQVFLKLNPSYLVSLIALKEIMLGKTFYQQYDLPYMTQTLVQLEQSLKGNMFKSKQPFVDYTMKYFDGAPCETFKSSLTNAQYSDCANLDLPRLSNGLKVFHNYYGDYVLDTLQLNDDTMFGTVSMDDVYKIGQLIRIIDGVFMDHTVSLWQDNMESFLASKEKLMIILIVVLSALNVIVFIIAEKGVVGTLNDRFSFYRKIFNKYMLGEALAREKRIKSRLVKYKVLNK